MDVFTHPPILLVPIGHAASGGERTPQRFEIINRVRQESLGKEDNIERQLDLVLGDN
jgi:hypothetical protein